MIMKKQDLYNKAIQMWGIEGQVDMFHEEVGELISALNKYKRGRVGKDAVVTEIADVQIMAEQLAVWFGENEVSREKEYKLNRLARRIQQKEVSDNGIATTDEGEPIEQSEVDVEKEIEKEIDRFWCSLFTDFTMERNPNHSPVFIPDPKYTKEGYRIAYALDIDWKDRKDFDGMAFGPEFLRSTARHFAEWGAIHLNARKEK